MLKFFQELHNRPSFMEGISIQRRVLVWICLLAMIVGIAGYSGYRKLHAQITDDATLAAGREMQGVQDLLDLHRHLYLQQVQTSMELFERETLALGMPHISGTVKGWDNVPNLMFGNTVMAHNTEVLNSIQSLMGGKTAILVRKGNNFIRVATNIVDAQGRPSVNTAIDPNGQAIIALNKGEVYSGIIDILGVAFIGEDDPIFDGNHQVIGAWFRGFKIENLQVLMSRINSTHILENGFIVLFDTNHKLVAQSAYARTDIVNTLCLQADLSPDPNFEIKAPRWYIRKQTFTPWDYGIISATYIPDVAARAINGVWFLFSVVGIIAFGALLAQGASLIRSQKLKDEAEKARLAAEEASRTKSAFLANMSHELRTPLNAIIGYSEMLVEDAIDRGQDDMEPDLRKIQGSGKHLLSLINDILDLSKIEAGKMTIYLEEFNVPQMIREIAAIIQPLLVKNGNELVIDCPEEVRAIFSDVTKTRQILFNLLSNASKFTKEGKVFLKVQRDSRTIYFSVRDTGVGIPPEAQGKIFREFSQADDSTTRKYGGTGLGLAISKRFCEMLGGSIRLESQAGVGTTFFVELPVKTEIAATSGVEVQQAPVPATDASSPVIIPSASDGARPTVLIIDDDPEVQDLMQRILEKEGYQVRIAASGQEAMSIAESIEPCLITLDIMMPGVDGWTVLAALKKSPKVRDIPVVVVTLVDNKPMALALGAADYVAKPFDRERIVQLLRKHAPTSTPHILIIEDDINSYEVMVRVLEKDGFKVSYAPNGRVALEMVQEAKPSLILLDLMMPEMNGFDFITELRKRETGPQTPVVVLSGRELTTPERNLLAQTVQKTLLKGALSTHDLVAEVRKYLPPPVLQNR